MGLSFAAPLALLGLFALPAIWRLLRVTPPAPREVMFPPIALLRDLAQKERAQVTTPWPLLLLRLVIAALAAFALAGPAWNWSAVRAARGPLLLVIDDGWAAAASWEKRVAAGARLLDASAHDGGQAAVIFASDSAPQPTLIDGARALEALRAAQPKPFLPDRSALARQVADFASAHQNAHIVWLSDGLGQGGADMLARALSQGGEAGASVEVLTDSRGTLALKGVANDARALETTVLRAGAGDGGVVEALDAKGRIVARESFSFAGGDRAAARFELPIELRNDVSQLRIAQEPSAGAVALLDAGLRVRRVAIVTSAKTPRCRCCRRVIISKERSRLSRSC